MTYEKIIEALPSLSQVQLKEIKGRITFLLNFKIRKVINPTPAQTQGTSYLRGVLLVHAGKIVVLPNKQKLDKLSERIDKATSELEIMGKKLGCSRKEMINLCRIVIESAEAKMKELGKAMTFYMLLSFISDPAVLLADAFPGYVTTSLFKAIVLK